MDEKKDCVIIETEFMKEIILDNNAYEQDKTNEEIERINISIKI